MTKSALYAIRSRRWLGSSRGWLHRIAPQIIILWAPIDFQHHVRPPLTRESPLWFHTDQLLLVLRPCLFRLGVHFCFDLLTAAWRKQQYCPPGHCYWVSQKCPGNFWLLPYLILKESILSDDKKGSWRRPAPYGNPKFEQVASKKVGLFEMVQQKEVVVCDHWSRDGVLEQESESRPLDVDSESYNTVRCLADRPLKGGIALHSQATLLFSHQ